MALVVTAAVDVAVSPPLKSSSATKLPSAAPPELMARSVVVPGVAPTGLLPVVGNNLDCLNGGLVGGSDGGLNLDDAVLVGGGIELLRDGSTDGSGLRKDIEVGQDLLAIDQYVELALPCRGGAKVHKMQTDVITTQRIQAGNSPCRGAPALHVVYRLRRRVGDQRSVDR